MTADFATWVKELDEKRGSKKKRLENEERSEEENDDDDDDMLLETALLIGNNQSREKSAEENLKELEQEMKLLKWHKLANDAALKAALIKTKRLKNKETKTKGNLRQMERAAWMQQVIQEEQSKPLEVDEAFIAEYKEKEARENKRVAKEMKAHLQNVRRLKEQAAKREDIRMRNLAYREKKQELAEKRKEVQDRALGLISIAAKTAEEETTVAILKENDLTALDKLVELEKRISSLEKDYKNGVSSKKGSASKKPVVFAKNRTAPAGGQPTRVKYHVRANASAKSNLKSSSSNRRRPREKKTIKNRPDEVEEDKTFLTSLPSVSKKSQSSALVKRSSTTATPVQKRNKNIRRTQSSQARSYLRGAKSQDQAVSKWIRDRTVKKTPQKIVSAKERMQEFAEVRKEYEKRKDIALRTLHGRSDGTIKRKRVPERKTPVPRRIPTTNRKKPVRATTNHMPQINFNLTGSSFKK